MTLWLGFMELVSHGTYWSKIEREGCLSNQICFWVRYCEKKNYGSQKSAVLNRKETGRGR